MADMQIVLAGKNVAPQYVEMKVPLYSHGCENKVKKALAHLRGIHSVEVDYHLQKVAVWGICNRDDVLATIRKKRREARFWDEPESDVQINKSEEKAVAVAVVEKARKAAILSRFKFRRSWKKLFPLVLVR